MSGIEVTTDGPILEVTIDIPKANAINAETSRKLGEVFSDFRDDHQSRVAILTGAGERFFSAGWDLTAAAEGEDYEADYGPGGFGGFPELPGLSKPVITAVNGMAVGGGFELVLASDLCIAADHAEFFFGELAVGVIPDSGSIRLPRLVPPTVAKELILTGRRMPAEEARGWGLVNRVVPVADLMDEARSVASVIAGMAPLAVEAALAVMKNTTHLDLPSAYAAIREGRVAEYTAMLQSSDALEGPRAFAEGRDPQWEGR